MKNAGREWSASCREHSVTDGAAKFLSSRLFYASLQMTCEHYIYDFVHVLFAACLNRRMKKSIQQTLA